LFLLVINVFRKILRKHENEKNLLLVIYLYLWLLHIFWILILWNIPFYNSIIYYITLKYCRKRLRKVLKCTFKIDSNTFILTYIHTILTRVIFTRFLFTCGTVCHIETAFQFGVTKARERYMWSVNIVNADVTIVRTCGRMF